jgi:hypothetical protein
MMALDVVMLSIVNKSIALNVIMLSAANKPIVLIVIILIVVMLSVVAPLKYFSEKTRHL